jgi:hypothetical protein
MATFNVRYETSLVHTISVEAANAEEAAKLARDRAREDEPEGEPEVYEISDSKGEPVWDSDGNTSFDPPEICPECGEAYPDEAETMIGPFHKPSCSLFSSTDNP